MVDAPKRNKPPDPGHNGRLSGIANRRWYQLVIIGIVQLVLTGIAIVAAVTIDHRSNQVWCEVVVSLDDGNKARPPTDDDGRRFAAEMSRLRRKLGCQ